MSSEFEDELEIVNDADNSVDPLNAETVDTVVDEDDNLLAGERMEETSVGFYDNLAETLDDLQLRGLAIQLLEDYKNDKMSRKDWVDNYVKGLDLLGFKYEAQTRPFIGASGVTHPLLAESATQFQAQAFKELLPADGPVRTEIVGAIDEVKEQQALRVKDFMNYQISDVMEEYTPDFDQMLFYLPLAGSTFKKVYYDSLLQRAVSKFIPAEDLVVPYNASDLHDAERITQIVKMNANDLRKLQVSGFYRDLDLPKPQMKEDDAQKKYDDLEGVKNTAQNYDLYNLIEMHVNLDLPGFEDDNGVKIPYVVTIDEDSMQILSIYRNYEPNDELKKRKHYFVHYKFLPGLGFYGFGLIHMIGGLSRAATAALRQLLDAATLKNLPAGFKSRGLRIRDDAEPLQPGEFRDVDAPGGNIKDQFQLLPFTEPSTTLYQLLGYCVDAGKRFAMIADMQVGDANQTAAVGTTIALLERGSRVMSAIHKRCYYAQKQEFKLLANVFSTYLPPEYPYDVYGASRIIKQADFDDKVDVIPVADPNIFSMAQRIQLAQTELQLAQSNPQIHNLHEAYKRMYESLGVKNIGAILQPPPEPPKPIDPAQENSGALQMVIPKAFPEQNHDAHINAHMAFMTSRMVQINPQVYALMQAHVSQHVGLKVKNRVLAQMLESEEMKQLQLQQPEEFAMLFESKVAEEIAVETQNLVAMERQFQAATGQDPLVQLKQQEIDLRALDIQRKIQEDDEKREFERQKFTAKQFLDEDKLNLNEEIQRRRVKVQEEKLEQEKRNASN